MVNTYVREPKLAEDPATVSSVPASLPELYKQRYELCTRRMDLLERSYLGLPMDKYIQFKRTELSASRDATFSVISDELGRGFIFGLRNLAFDWQVLSASNKQMGAAFEAFSEQKAKHRVVAVYSGFSNVEAIFLSRRRNKMVFWIFTNEEKYERVVLREMIENEVKIMDEFPDLRIAFEYVPSIFCDRYAEITGEPAEKILER